LAGRLVRMDQATRRVAIEHGRGLAVRRESGLEVRRVLDLLDRRPEPGTLRAVLKAALALLADSLFGTPGVGQPTLPYRSAMGFFRFSCSWESYKVPRILSSHRGTRGGGLAAVATVG